MKEGRNHFRVVAVVNELIALPLKVALLPLRGERKEGRNLPKVNEKKGWDGPKKSMRQGKGS
jgi:hypothetical protein